jgi:hypothetical protein
MSEKIMISEPTLLTYERHELAVDVALTSTISE